MKLAKYLRDPSRVLRKLRWRRLYAGPRRDVTVDTYNGRLTFDSRDKLIGKYLFVDRAYERRWLEDAMRVLRRDGHLPPAGGGTLLDVGANIGMICIALLRQGWFDRAIAFEPAPGNYRLLRHNLAQNDAEARVHALQLALSDVPGELPLELSEYNSGDNRIRSAALDGAFHEARRDVVTVPVDTLDRALEAADVRAGDVRLIWVDIQGHEARFFEGARGTLAAGMPVVSEFWPYGIFRAGTTRERYLHTVRALFTHFYRLQDHRAEKLPIARIDALFDELAKPRQMAELIFVRET
jgi:FkbM family methyltransferase